VRSARSRSAMLGELVAVEEPEHRLGVADVDREQHASL
jgi:hypothetical protein